MKNRVLTPDKKYLYIAKAVVVLAMYFSFQGCRSDVNVIQDLQAYKEAILVMDNVDMVQTDSGMIKLRLRAPVMKKFDFDDNPYTEFPEGIHVESFDRDSTITGEIKAKYAINYEKKDLWEARGDVVAINSVGDRLNTEILFWDRKEHKIYNNVVARITMIGKGIHIGENGMESYMDEDGGFTSFEFKKSTGNVVAKSMEQRSMPVNNNAENIPAEVPAEAPVEAPAEAPADSL